MASPSPRPRIARCGHSPVMILLGIGTAAATTITSNKSPVAKNSQFQMLAEEPQTGEKKRIRAMNHPQDDKKKVQKEKHHGLGGGENAKTTAPPRRGGSTDPNIRPNPTQGNTKKCNSGWPPPRRFPPPWSVEVTPN